MDAHNWFVHVQGENLGPFTLDLVSRLLQQNRLHFVDFVWAPHLTKWQRIVDLDEFAELLPAYPKIPVPSRQAGPTTAPSRSSPPAREPELTESVTKRPKAKKAAEKSWPKARRFVRVPAEGTVILEGHGEFELVNLSEGGIFLKSKEALPIGTELKFCLRLKSPPKEFEMTGVVIRHGVVDGHSGFVVEFTRLNPAHKRLFVAYVAEHSENP